MAATCQLDEAVTLTGRVHRSGRRIVGQPGIAYGVGKSQQVVGARLRLLLDNEPDHFPAAWRRQGLCVRLAEVVAMWLDLVRQWTQDRRGISIGVSQRRGGWIRASSSRASA